MAVHAPSASSVLTAVFTHPNPSYLPAIEEHIASLKAHPDIVWSSCLDHAMASLTAEIDAFAKVAERVALRRAGPRGR